MELVECSWIVSNFRGFVHGFCRIFVGCVEFVLIFYGFGGILVQFSWIWLNLRGIFVDFVEF